MIWWIIGYYGIGTVATFLAEYGFLRAAERRGYNANEFYRYMYDFYEKRMRVNNIDKTSLNFKLIAFTLLEYTAWPVLILQRRFLDMPYAIEYYESLHNEEEA